MMDTDKKMAGKREWMRCSMVVVAFYLIVYALIGGKILGFLNPWLIGSVVVLAVIDIVVLQKYITQYMDQDDQHLP